MSISVSLLPVLQDRAVFHRRSRVVPPCHRLAATGAALVLCASLDLAAGQQTELISRPSNPDYFGALGALASGSNGCSISADGSRIAFSTDAFNLFEDDRNRDSDVLVHDAVSGSLFPVSVTSAGLPADGASRRQAISGDGRYVLFESDAPNLGGSGSVEVYRHDLQTGQTVAVSLDPGGLPFTTTANAQDLSGTGNLAVFTADSQVWLRDLALGQTELVSSGIDGLPADEFARNPRISGLGGYVVFETAATNLVAGDANGLNDVFVFDRGLGTLERIVGLAGAEPDAASDDPDVSADGRWVAFSSLATNLVADDTEGNLDVFLHDRQTDTTIRLSEDAFGIGGDGFSQRPKISADGRFVVFESRATNLGAGLSGDETRLFLYDRTLESLDRVAADGFGPVFPCIASTRDEVAIGFNIRTHAVLPPGTNPSQVLVERQTQPGQTGSSTPLPGAEGAGPPDIEVVSRGVPPLPVTVGTGPSEMPAVSLNGAFLAFRTSADNIVGRSGFRNQIVRLDLDSRQIATVSNTLDGDFDVTWIPSNPSISGNGNLIVFDSRSSLLVSNDTNDIDDVFVRNMQLGQTRRISVDSSGIEGNSASTRPQISANGNSIVFESSATNLVPGDANGRRDVFVHDLDTDLTERVSISTVGAETDENSEFPSVSADGRFVVLQTRGNLLDVPTPITATQIWLRDRQLEQTELISVAVDGTPGNGFSSRAQISSNGRWVAFKSGAGNLDPAFPGFSSEAVYLRDRQLGTTHLISLDENQQPLIDGVIDDVRLAPGGQVVAFSQRESGGQPNAGPGGPDGSGADARVIYVHRIDSQTTVRIEPRTFDGLPPDDDLFSAALSANGRMVYLVSSAGNLLPDMLNGVSDIYRIDLDRVFGDGFEG